MKKLLDSAAKLLYPDRCLFCGGVVEAGAFCCGRCRPVLPAIPPDRCIYCNQPLLRCACPAGLTRPYCRLTAVFEYTGPVRRAVAAFKFGGRRSAAGYFAGLMARQLKAQGGDLPFDLITCVPMSRQKQRQRGYNQSELLAKELSALLGVPFKPLLLRSGILTQHDLSAQFRRLGARAAFHAAPGANLRGRRVLLVDDIATTGSTLEQCAWMLRDAGAAKVSCVTIAFAPNKEKR